MYILLKDTTKVMLLSTVNCKQTIKQEALSDLA